MNTEPLSDSKICIFPFHMLILEGPQLNYASTFPVACGGVSEHKMNKQLIDDSSRLAARRINLDRTMRRVLPYLLGTCWIVVAPICHAQAFRVSDPRLELRDNTIHITYDILESDPSDEFTVDLVVTDAEGKRIHAAALSGDVGEMVSGGSNKHIAWDLSVDRIEMDARIYVKVHVKAIPPPEPEIIPPVQEETALESSEDKSDEGIETAAQPEGGNEVSFQGETVKDSPSALTGRGFSRTGLVLQSVAFPGLGLSRATGNPHWIRGVAGYGCLAGAVILNRTAISNYAGIMDLTGYDEKNELYRKSLSQDQVSELLAYAAIGIWVSDIIWTLVGTSDLKMSALSNHRRGFSLYTSVERVTPAPVIGIVYRF
jgi:hypothetical protein